jgi:uncharacterized protein (DUF488 family)
MPDRIYTIGFTGKNAEAFFEILRAAQVARVIDIRLNNTSQLSGFTKRDDLRYFLARILGLAYAHLPDLAPTKGLLDQYRADHDWNAYTEHFVRLLAKRSIEQRVDLQLFEPQVALLCSEPRPERCHRSLVAEYLRDTLWPDVVIAHL